MFFFDFLHQPKLDRALYEERPLSYVIRLATSDCRGVALPSLSTHSLGKSSRDLKTGGLHLLIGSGARYKAASPLQPESVLRHSSFAKINALRAHQRSNPKVKASVALSYALWCSRDIDNENIWIG